MQPVRSTGGQINERLSPSLTAVGFAVGQVGQSPDGACQVLFCASYDDLAKVYPELPQADGQVRGEGNCVDFTISLDSDGRVQRVDFEQLSLEQTFRHLGRPNEADRVRNIIGSPADQALPAISECVRGLFRI